MKHLACLVLVFGSLDAYAGGNYACEITGAFRVDQSGKQNIEALRALVGDKFSVDRATGIMTGALENSYVSGPTVVDHGSKESSYKAINSMNSPVYDGTSLNFLEIQENIVGKTKPFVYLNGADVFYGKCVHN